MRLMRSGVARTAVLTTLACSDDGTGPDLGQQAMIQGRVEQPAPEGVAYPTSSAMRAGASGAASASTDPPNTRNRP